MKTQNNLTIHQKIALAIINNALNQTLTCQEIITIVQLEYPEIPRGSIIPSDLCKNKINKDPQSGIHHVFHYEGKNRYKVLPESIIKSTNNLENNIKKSRNP